MLEIKIVAVKLWRQRLSRLNQPRKKKKEGVNRYAHVATHSWLGETHGGWSGSLWFAGFLFLFFFPHPMICHAERLELSHFVDFTLFLWKHILFGQQRSSPTTRTHHLNPTNYTPHVAHRVPCFLLYLLLSLCFFLSFFFIMFIQNLSRKDFLVN